MYLLSCCLSFYSNYIPTHNRLGTYNVQISYTIGSVRDQKNECIKPSITYIFRVDYLAKEFFLFCKSVIVLTYL